MQYYLSIFKDGKLKSYQAYKDTTSGSFDFATIEISGMDLQSIHPYLTFNGNCREAMIFYKNTSAVN